MSEPLLHRESPTEYFRDLVESALQHQHVTVRELTSYYVVNPLAGGSFVKLFSTHPPIEDRVARLQKMRAF